jgi:hypothetical protein
MWHVWGTGENAYMGQLRKHGLSSRREDNIKMVLKLLGRDAVQEMAE